MIDAYNKTGANKLSSVINTEDKQITDLAEANPNNRIVQQLNITNLQENLGHCLEIFDDEVMRGYITKIEKLELISSDTNSFDGLDDVYFYKINKIVYQEDELATDKLAMMFQTFADFPCTLVLMVRSDGCTTNFYLGVRSDDSAYATSTLAKNLQNTFLGFFPGSNMSRYFREDFQKDLKDDLSPNRINAIANVTGIADYKSEQGHQKNESFIQGLENYVYAMNGKSYTAYFIADNIEHDRLEDQRRSLEQIYSEISPFANMQLNFAVNDGTSESQGTMKSSTTSQTQTTNESHAKGTNQAMSENKNYSEQNSTSDGTNQNTTYSDSTAHGTSSTDTVGMFTSVGKSWGKSAGISSKHFNIGRSKSVNVTVGSSVAHSKTISDTLTNGISKGSGTSHSTTHSTGTGYGTSVTNGSMVTDAEGIAQSYSEATGLETTKSTTKNLGQSKGITLNEQVKPIQVAMERIEQNLKRINDCENYGMWDFAAYFVSDTLAEAETAAGIYKALVTGNNSNVTHNAVNVWTDGRKISQILPYLQHMMHPHFYYPGFCYGNTRREDVTASIPISSNELAIHMGLPRHSIQGLSVIQHVPFGQTVVRAGLDGDDTINAEDQLSIGKIWHMGKVYDNADVVLNVNDLNKHTFITGSTGSGKSNAVYKLLEQIQHHMTTEKDGTRKKIPFLVVEPAKGEYRQVFPEVPCYGTNPNIGELLKINPFSFPKGIHVLEHIDRLVEIFNVCWPMYAAMPAVLKDSIERAYISAGWDLNRSVNSTSDELYPNFGDVLRELNTTIKESSYSDETKGDYIGSLATRLRSLTNGINGLLFSGEELNLSRIFDQSAIIDISRVGSTETKSLIMGLVVLKLQEYRVANADGMNQPLRHVTVLEEAHNLLKKTSTEQSAESSNLAGKSVEMLTNTIAEIRTYGEGFIIVDQAPNLLDTAVIRNTNTKIVLRLPDRADRELTGGAMALSDEQTEELAKLPTGVAAVYQNDWEEAVLCKVPFYIQRKSYVRRKQSNTTALQKTKEDSENKLTHILLQNHISNEEKAEERKLIICSNISTDIKKYLIDHIDDVTPEKQQKIGRYILETRDIRINCLLNNFANCQNIVEYSNTLRNNLMPYMTGYEDDEISIALHAISYEIANIHPSMEPLLQRMSKYY